MRVSPLFRTPSRFGPPSKNDISPPPAKIPADVDNFSSLQAPAWRLWKAFRLLRGRSLCPRTSPAQPDRMSTAKDRHPLRPEKSRSRSSAFGFRSCLRGEFPLFPLAPSPGKRPPALFAPWSAADLFALELHPPPPDRKCCPDDRLCRIGSKGEKVFGRHTSKKNLDKFPKSGCKIGQIVLYLKCLQIH